MRFAALAIITVGALTASIDTAAAQINCGPGMNSDGYRCFPAWQRHEYGGYGGYGGYGYGGPPIVGGGYYRPRGHVIDCGPGMNSDGYRCFPISQRHEYRYGYHQPRYYQRDYYQAPRRAPGGGCYGPTGVYDPRGC